MLRVLPPLLLLGASLTAPFAVQAQSGAARAVDIQERSQRDAKRSQDQIDRLDAQTREMLEKYRAASWQAQQLTVYADQLQQLVDEQEKEKSSLKEQLTEVQITEREILPLMLRMLQGLEKFVELDLPFRQEERAERLKNLRKLMSDPSAGLADRFRRLLEAYKVESDYGRALGAERTEIELGGERRAVDVLHVGRVSLYYLSLDGSETGQWNAERRRWEPMDDRYASAVRKGLKIARETAAAELFVLPVPPATTGGEQ